MIKCSAIILAGGRSSRMGYNPKALLKYNNKTFLELEIEALEEFKEIIISCNDSNIYKNYTQYKIIGDCIKDIGPMGGFYSTLKEIKEEKAIIVSCDMPFINKNILNYLGNIEFKEECLIPVLNGEIEPFCGVYKKTILNKLEEAIKEEHYGLRKFIKSLDVKYIEIKEVQNFINVNTPEEYEKILKR